MNFDPDPSRPIYCNDCFSKKKDGQQVPLLHKPIVQTQHERTNQRDVLSSLGIEYDVSQPAKQERQAPSRQENRPVRQESGSAPARAPARQESRRPSNVRPVMSLDKAIKKEPVSFKRSRKEVDLEDLRSTLKEVMGNQNNDGEKVK